MMDVQAIKTRMGNCRVCGGDTGKTLLFRCEAHHKCDDCGVDDNLVYRTEGLLCEPCHKVRVTKRMAEFDESEAELTHEITCPYCGYEVGDSFDGYPDHDENKKCGDCRNVYEYERIVTIEYSSTRKTTEG